jgi:hypothetical protein
MRCRARRTYQWGEPGVNQLWVLSPLSLSSSRMILRVRRAHRGSSYALGREAKRRAEPAPST